MIRTCLAVLAFGPLAFSEAGVLLPAGQRQPDPSVLSLREMDVRIRIDNGDARVDIRQIYANHTDRILEGNYLFALPSRALVSDFAVWDGLTRIPGVILERKRAEELYDDIRQQQIDPGLLQMGERSADEAGRSAVFSARVVPIPAFGTKRIEIQYHETIPVEDFQSVFALPLRPDAYQAMTAGRISIEFELRSAHAIGDFKVLGNAFPLQILERTPHLVRGVFEGTNVRFREDFAVRYAFDPGAGDRLEILTYRNPDPELPSPADPAPAPSASEPGFFQASVLLASGKTPGSSGQPRAIVALFDNSLSMQWEKLERNFLALERLLLGLRPSDQFNLILFNTAATPFAPALVSAETAAVEKAIAFVRGSPLRGGTDLDTALAAAVAQLSASPLEGYIVLLSDGNATRGPIGTRKLAAAYAARLAQIPEAHRPRTFVFAVGDDANLPLLRLLVRENGVLENVRSTEPPEFKLAAFLSKIGRNPVQALRLTANPAAAVHLVYPLDSTVFAGSAATWIGQYRATAQSAAFTAGGIRDGQPFEMRATSALPERALEHERLPRTWAKARVDALLEKIARDGEDRASIDEIIRLARKYKFVTPYTSFLAAPRSLLRPRVIRPGDPILRVKTDSSIVSVVALFPFGLVKSLRYLADEEIWQTRFLAPVDMNDGTYRVRLVLRDRNGQVYRESKSFVIASKPPVVRVKLDKARYRPGETVRLRVAASATTRTIVARLYGTPPVGLRWNDAAGVNTGELSVPSHLPAGKYKLNVIAEDFAHNIGSQEVALEVAP